MAKADAGVFIGVGRGERAAQEMDGETSGWMQDMMERVNRKSANLQSRQMD